MLVRADPAIFDLHVGDDRYLGLVARAERLEAHHRGPTAQARPPRVRTAFREHVDQHWYALRYPDVAAANFDPEQHFLLHKVATRAASRMRRRKISQARLPTLTWSGTSRDIRMWARPASTLAVTT